MSAPGNDAARARALAASLAERAPLWRAAEQRRQRLARATSDDAEDAARLADDYRLLAHDLARARTLIPDTRTREYLEGAYARAHAALYHGAWNLGSELVKLFRDEIPAVVRSLAPYIAWSTGLFVLTALAGFALVHRYPELIALFASPDLIASVEHGHLWTQGILNIMPSAVLSVQLLANNIVVTLFAYCFGFLFGLGTLYIVGLNGLMLGAVFAFVSRHGLAGPLFAFMAAHGFVELSVVCLAGAAGAAVGEALIRPGQATRLEAFRAAALRTGKLLIAGAVLLVGSGFLEGYISPDPRFSLTTRLVIGIGYWLVMVALLSGRLFPRARPLRSAA